LYIKEYQKFGVLMRISIIGSGVVGSATGKGFHKLGHNVVFNDIDSEKIKKLKKEGYSATNEIKDLLKTDVSFVCVPTPTGKKFQKLSFVKKALKDLSIVLKEKEKYHLIVIKSTILPTTCERELIPIIEKYSGRKVGKEIGFCFNPEFLREKNALEDFLNPDRIVIGQYDDKSGHILEKLYKKLNCPILRTDLRTAEIAKYANNTFYATKISFFNEIHMICKRLGIDSNCVRKIVQLDRFYGTHPWNHGHAFGGMCLPKDLKALISFCNDGHIYMPYLLKSVQRVNERMENDK
jgi:UDPglucose 6-dehydrogenase